MAPLQRTRRTRPVRSETASGGELLLTTHALKTSDDPLALRALRHLDLVVLALALPVFLLAGFPLLGWGAAAAAWLAQRLIADSLTRRARRSGDPRTVAGLMTGSMIGRGWLVALGIFAAGMVEREAGLTAAVLAIVLFTMWFATQMATRPFEVLDARDTKPSR